MHYHFAVQWLKAFRHSADAICALYADDFVFEDVMLDQHDIRTKSDLHRNFLPYANRDPDNGIGIHNFRIRAYIGDRRSGLIRWEWIPEHAAQFLGLDVRGKPFATQGHTWHQYDERGLITRESSWWDAAAVLRAVGPVSPTKSLTGIAGRAASAPAAAFTRASGMAHARRWCAALGADTGALAALYADRFTLETTMVDDHLQDTISDRAMLAAQLGGIAGGDNGRYTFTPTAYFGDDPGWGLIHWNVTIEGARSYRGIATGGRRLSTIGSTFHQFDADGRILLESTYWEDNGVFQQLGLPIVRPHYWKEDFDPASLAG